MGRKFRTASAASNSITKSLNSIVNHFLDDFFDEVKKTTPVRKGQAKRGWRKRNKYDIDRKGKTTVMENRVPYIGLLDEGASRQAPRGMTDPAFRKLSKRRYRKRL
ncbi:MAG: hypothetical protein CMJ25_21435 [Phycisphaerae bacterium]|nr:hypothetical protein [Phycisphaerae bacterium]|tara:strand:+ start:8669 stop:8986 length:318 start_codon:yes stop_codon:yes gene_type:complete